jgi:glycosyltransferase involved in cell wall biosynthesis
MSQPLVSIIMNCFNGEKYLFDAMQSVVNQTYEHWELIVWDNCSTDQSSKIIKSFSDTRIKYHQAETHLETLYAARNEALQLCHGSLICFLDVDDWWADNKLINQIHLFNDPEIGVAASNYYLVNENRKTTKDMRMHFETSSDATNDLMKNYFVALVTIMMRKEILEDLGGFNSKYHILGDFDLVMTLSTITKLGFTNAPLAYLRKHSNNESSLKRNLGITELQDWISKASKNKNFNSLSNFRILKGKYFYQLAVSLVINKNKLKALPFLLKVEKLSFMFKLIILFFTPQIIIKRLSV